MSTEYSAFDAPRLPPPTEPPGRPLTEPPAALPPLPAAPATGPDTLHTPDPSTTDPGATDPGATDHGATDHGATTGVAALPPPNPIAVAAADLEADTGAGTGTGAGGRRGRGSRVPIGWLLLAFAAAIVGLTTFLMIRGSNDGDSDGSQLGPAALGAQTSETTAEAETAVGQILDDAQAVVDELNDRSGEREVLAELGLDENGNPIDDGPAEATDDLAGYRFTWADPSGQDLDITVDLTTGNFSVDASDGIRFRSIDGTFYGSAAGSASGPASGSTGESGDESGDEAGDESSAAWFELAEDPFGDTPVIGLDGLPDIPGVMPDVTAPYLVNGGLKDGGTGPTYFFIVDDEALHAAEPEARAEWLRPWGLIEPATVEPTTLVVTITLDPVDRRVVGAQIETPTIGGFASYTVVETFDAAPTIDVPGS